MEFKFNPSNCEAVTFMKKTKPVKAEYKLHDVILASVTSAKYLGVHISSKLSWNTHVDISVKKATQSLNFILRNLSCCPACICEQCYETLVRPQLKCAGAGQRRQMLHHKSRSCTAKCSPFHLP